MPGELIFPVNYTIWIPKNLKSIRGVIVHQHGCGEGSCKSGLTGAYDLHWQALAKKHDCALLAPSSATGESRLPNVTIPAMVLLRRVKERWLILARKLAIQSCQRCRGHCGDIAAGGTGPAAWCCCTRNVSPPPGCASGVPLLKPDPARVTIKAHTLPDAALKVPLMCNQEGVTVKDGRFAGVWPANEAFFNAVRSKGGLISVAVDPITAHRCGNQRYSAIPWLDACLSARLPKVSGEPIQDMPTDNTWLALSPAPRPFPPRPLPVIP